jgi:hypothetical protein
MKESALLSRADKLVEQDVDFRYWHRADIKLRPLFGRDRVESGGHWLVMSISPFDPNRTSGGLARYGQVDQGSRRIT